MTDGARALDRRTAMVTAAVAVLLGFFAMNDLPIGVFQDDGHYLILARAIAGGDGYHYVNLPGVPAATHFPPGYPLLLAPLWWIAPRFPANIAYFKLVNVALLPVLALAIRALARRAGGLSTPVSSAIAIASVATVPVLFLNGLLFSETAFMAAMCGALIASERLVARDVVRDAARDAARDVVPSVRAAVLLGLALGALAMLRTVGVTLLPAVLALLLWRRRWRDAALVVTGALAVLGPWQLWASLHARAVPAAVAGAYGGYGPWIADAWREGGFAFARAVAAVNLRGLLMPLTLFGLAESSVLVRGLAATALLTLAGTGAWRLWPRAPVSVLLFIPYVALLLLWPFPPDRFLWPLWPLVLVFLVTGTLHLGRGVAHGAPRALRAQLALRVSALFAAALLGACLVVWHVPNYRARSWESPARINAKMGFAAAGVAAALPPDGLVASDQDAMVHLYTGRQAVPLVALTAAQHVRERTDAEVTAQLAAVIDAYHPRWLVVAQRESLRGARLLARSGRLKFMGADTAGVLVYDVVR